ncbi:MAG: hypothetical protein JXA66_09445 [Oligoflexia bacterium]|nr:hypothetical protein [Oligoflexia bacterium]
MFRIFFYSVLVLSSGLYAEQKTSSECGKIFAYLRNNNVAQLGITLRQNPECIEYKNADKETPLQWAINNEKIPLAMLLVTDFKADISNTTDGMRTLLHLLAQDESSVRLNTIFKTNRNKAVHIMEAKDGDELTALERAFYTGYDENALFLANNNASIANLEWKALTYWHGISSSNFGEVTVELDPNAMRKQS